MKTLLFAMLLALPAALLQARDFYVDNVRGTDRNDGLDRNRPCATLAQAVKNLQPGDILHLVDSGKPYSESLKLSQRSGTPEKPIIIDGGNALLSGMITTRREDWETLADGRLRYRYPGRKLSPNCRPRLQVDGRFCVHNPNADQLRPGEYSWQEGAVIYYRPLAAGAGDRPLLVSGRESGVAINSSSYLVIRRLKCEGFYNDGFNLHGDCRGVFFEHIESRFNGDDGFSAHEDISATVRYGYFHDNAYGIEDICASQTDYYGVTLENNDVGVHFAGGVHRLTDCRIINSKTFQLRIDHGWTSGGRFGKDAGGPLYRGIAFVKNTELTGGDIAIQVNRLSSAMIVDCRIGGALTALKLLKGAAVELRGCSITGSRLADIDTPAQGLMQDFNTFSSGNFIVDEKKFAPGQWKEFLSAIKSPNSRSKISP